jgi:hypothetical protein
MHSDYRPGAGVMNLVEMSRSLKVGLPIPPATPSENALILLET